MKNSMFILSFFLVIAWIIGYFSTSIGSSIHILLVLAIVAVVLGFDQRGKSLKKLIDKLT